MNIVSTHTGEAVVCLEENGRYEFELSSPGYALKEISGILRASRLSGRKACGVIEPGNYVGLLKVELIETISGKGISKLHLDVRSRKLSYESEYRKMLEDIADRCADFLLQLDSPVEQDFVPDDEQSEATLAQRLYFLKSLLGGEDFQMAVQRIVSMPNTQWTQEIKSVDVRRSRRLGRKEVRQFASASRRMATPETHALHGRLASLPEKLQVEDKRDTVDTPENRFVKYALQVFSQCLEDLVQKFSGKKGAGYPGLQSEIGALIDGLEETLSHEVFKQVSMPTLLPLNSPVLQRKEGYRQVLRSWMLFELAARLSWAGGDDVYQGGKRDAAALYEYWVFFKLLDLVAELFELEKPLVEELINDKDLVLKLKAGKHMPIKGVYKGAGRPLQIEFSYNRSFGVNGYPAQGSWTRQMRPDYTLSLWPAEFTATEAEVQEVITHVHFDAKYKVDRLTQLFGRSDEDLDEEKRQQRAGTYKRGDLLKMHAYRDAIRRSAGAYVLYPGPEKEAAPFRGFHELLPGLGAFPLRPDAMDDGSNAVKLFLKEVVAHVCNRASQHEQQTYHRYRIHKDEPPDRLHETLPEIEPETGVRGAPVVDTAVLVGYYKGASHLKWIQKAGLYNFRAGSGPGSLVLGPGVSDAQYVLLHGPGELITGRLCKVVGAGPNVYAKEALVDKGYPSEPSLPYYMVYALDVLKQGNPLNDYTWDVRKLSGWREHRGSGYPFATTLSELMKARVSL
ncbi:DUF2357 domain-containing protein [Kiritimatiellota bacterium B12222]|nr:DUF2357 domain-containing protein [Kiritimatiellota bacterium B12222]